MKCHSILLFTVVQACRPFWEIHEKVLKISEIVGFSREGAGSGLGSILMEFVTILGAFGKQNRKKGGPETLTKNEWKKVLRDFSRKFE